MRAISECDRSCVNVNTKQAWKVLNIVAFVQRTWTRYRLLLALANGVFVLPFYLHPPTHFADLLGDSLGLFIALHDPGSQAVFSLNG